MTSAAALLSVRSKLDDDAVGVKSILNENLSRSAIGNQVGGGNKSFVLNNKRIIGAVSPSPTTLIVTADGTVVTQATEDDVRGRFTLTNAPATSLFATYDFQYFTDAELTQIINDGLNFVSCTDITTLNPGLTDALIYKAASDGAAKIAMRTGLYYNQSAGGKAAQKGTIADKFLKLSQQYMKQAVDERAAFYGPRKGASTSPASANAALRSPVWPPRR